jgi:hypothetical protein
MARINKSKGGRDAELLEFTFSLGSPLTTSPDLVTVNATTGKISLSDQVINPGVVATFVIGNAFVNMCSIVNALPSGQVLYVNEVAAQGFAMAPFATGGMMYAFNVF